jgi:hypothetical protein
MRGSPLVRALVVFALLLCLAPILWRMTHEEAGANVEAPVSEKVTAIELPIELAFTAAPKRVTINHLGKQVWTKDNPEASEEFTLTLPWPKEGGELNFSVEWPESSPRSAMRAKLVDPEHGEMERSLWGRGTKTGVLEFP